MHVDVVIPLYNGSAFIAETLDSVYRQTLPPGKVIVVDDRSTDGSPEIVARRFPRAILLRNGDKGPATARNLGVRHTSSPLVAFLDSDDLWHPRHLENLSGLLERHPDCVLAASGLKSFPHGAEPVFDLSDTSFDRFDPWEVYPTHDFACTPSITMVRRETLLRCGGWSRSYDAISDYFLWMSLSVHGPVVRSRIRSAAYRLHGESITARYRRDPYGYMDLSLRCDDEAMRLFLGSRRSGQEKASVRRRNATAHCLMAVLRSLAGDDREALAASVRSLGDRLADEPPRYVKSLLGHLIFVSRHVLAGGDTASVNRRFAALLETWPDESRAAKKMLTGMIVETQPGIGFYLRYFARDPGKLRRLTPLFVAVRAKLTATSPGLTPASASPE